MTRFRSKLLSRAALAPILALAMPIAPALAQDEPAEEGAGQDEAEIVVTAQFREQDLQDTPIAITAMSGEMLEARSQTNVAQVAAQAPGLNLQPGNASFGPSLAASIRGVGQYDYSPAVEPGVGFYVDDVYYPSLTGAIFDLLDLDRIEILRGPQGTLAGRNSIGGAVKLYSKKPTGSGTGMVQGTYGSRNRIDLRASADFALAPDLNARIAGVAKRQRGYVDVLDFGCVYPQGSPQNPATGGVPATRAAGDCLVDRYGDVNYQAIRGQIRYNPSDAIDILIAADYVSDTRAPTASVLTIANNPATGRIRGPYVNTVYDARFICGPFCNYATGQMPADPANGVRYDTTRPLESTYEGYGFSAQADFELADWLKLTSITAYREFESVFATDADLSPLPVNGSSADLDLRFFSQEVRLNGTLANDTVLFTLGGFYGDQKTVFANIQDIRGSGLQFQSLGDTVPATSLAFFGHVSWEIVDGLTFNGGIRHTEEKKDYLFSRRNADGSVGQPVVGSLDGQVGKYREKRFDYRANVQYAWTPNVMTYVQYSTGYKGGGINPRPYYPSQVQPFNAEAIEAWEVGLKSDFLDRRVRLNLSAFANKYSDIQLVLTSCPQFTPGGAPAPCAMTASAGDADVKGFEVETTLRPVDGFLIDGSLSHIDFEYTSIAPAAAAGAGGVRLTDVAPFFSKWKWSIGAQYEVALGGGGSTLTPRLDLSYQSSFSTAARNVPSANVPGYTVLNGRITWRNADRDLDVSLEVTNILDDYYLLNVFDQTVGGGYAFGQPARPREWAATVTKRF